LSGLRLLAQLLDPKTVLLRYVAILFRLLAVAQRVAVSILLGHLPSTRPFCVALRGLSPTRRTLESVANPLEEEPGAIALLGEETQATEHEDPALKDRDETPDHPDDDQQRPDRQAGDSKRMASHRWT
jgi:hypothetical protein